MKQYDEHVVAPTCEVALPQGRTLWEIKAHTNILAGKWPRTYYEPDDDEKYQIRIAPDGRIHREPL